MPSFKMKFSGVTILEGVEFSIFSIDFEWALQQCSATALPVMFFFSLPRQSWRHYRMRVEDQLSIFRSLSIRQ